MRYIARNFRRTLWATAVAASLAGCDGLLDVDDPGRFTDDDLNEALEAVANGVEGGLYDEWSYHVIQRALASDEFQHTGTWAPWDDIDKGRIIYGEGTQTNTYQDFFLQNRWFAQDAELRFERELEADAATHPFMVQVKSVEAWADLMIGSAWCEAPVDSGGPAVPREEVLAQAAAKAAAAAQLAQDAGENAYYLANKVAEARSQLYLGNLEEAYTAAAAVPDDFTHWATYSTNTQDQYNDIVNLTTAGFNRAAGLREYYWDWVDTKEGLLIDPWTKELDGRVPIRFDGERGVDGTTNHYSQWKYRSLDADIRFFSGTEARLIEAEVHWKRGELGEAMERINAVRENAGLSPLDAGASADVVFEYLAHERFAEFFLEGHRMVDLFRWGLHDRFIAEGRYAGTRTPRTVLFPLSRGEALWNENITDALGDRCLPRVG